MKKFILLTLCSLFLISCGQPMPPIGRVTDKQFIAEYTTYITTYVQSGRVMIPVMTPIHYPNRWIITIQDLKTGELFDFQTTHQKFEALSQNDTIKVYDYELQ